MGSEVTSWRKRRNPRTGTPGDLPCPPRPAVGPGRADLSPSSGNLVIMGKTALIVIDMINTYDHEDADSLIPAVESVLPAQTGLL